MGRPKKYKEKTIVLSFRVPLSKKDKIFNWVNEQLTEDQPNPQKEPNRAVVSEMEKQFQEILNSKKDGNKTAG